MAVGKCKEKENTREHLGPNSRLGQDSHHARDSGKILTSTACHNQTANQNRLTPVLPKHTDLLTTQQAQELRGGVGGGGGGGVVETGQALRVALWSQQLPPPVSSVRHGQ